MKNTELRHSRVGGNPASQHTLDSRLRGNDENVRWMIASIAQAKRATLATRNGFSARNLWNMLVFYRDYVQRPKLQPLVAEISWAKNLVILARCKDDWRAKTRPLAL